ncbi:MAG: DUF1553 domain-containing protein [Acidobacteria bacterium]|nr:DUF1553 domain-containing protein [Acidobacteriota bacterium]
MRRPVLWGLLVLLSVVPFLVRSAETGGDFTPAQRKYWAFQPVTKPAVPVVKNKAWVQNPIDAFILAKLEEKKIPPAARADKITLIRRATFDLTGLPPRPQDVEAFLADKSPQAFAKVVDRLLNSPQYGERWARHWLDLARYAESEGFKSDETRPYVWRYRDYVINSFNQDKPYDRFVQEQIAGDELWPQDPEALVATGFNRHFPDESNARNLRQRRQEILNDITDTVGATFLGMTYACARCHDHKFDPIKHKDYYRLQAYFAGTRANDELPLVPQTEREKYQQQLSVWEEKTKEIRAEMRGLVEPMIKKTYDDAFAKFPEEIQEAVNTPPDKRTAFQWQMYYKAKPQLVVDTDDAAKRLKGEQRKRWQEMNAKLAEFAPLDPGEMAIGSGIVDIGREAPETFTLAVGVYDAPKDKVEPGPLSILDPNPAQILPVPNPNSSGRRAALARWLTDPKNPLSTRVMANRIWHYHFGRGIAGAPSDFGLMGESPSNPALLDWLTATFIENGWSIKSMHRLIMLSSTYQQSSSNPAAVSDTSNRLFARYPRHRLEGEAIRDAILAVSGDLNPNMGGPSVFPELPPGLNPRGGWKTSADPADRNRRSVYVFVRRNMRYPMFEAFDMPDTHESCARRYTSTTAPQALVLLNSKQVLESAQSFAGEVLEKAGADRKAQVELAYRLAYSRTPDAAERDTALTFLSTHQPILEERVAQNQPIPLPGKLPEGVDKVEAAALVDFCHMLLNSNEFVYLN